MYFGTYNRTLDEKGRLQMPSKLLSENCKSLYIMKGFDGCVSIYEEEHFQGFVGKLNSMDYFDKESRDFVRNASASIAKLEIDAHGRISLGKQILDTYGISAEVTLIGVLDHLELWDSVKYENYQAATLGKFDNAGRAN